MAEENIENEKGGRAAYPNVLEKKPNLNPNPNPLY